MTDETQTVQTPSGQKPRFTYYALGLVLIVIVAGYLIFSGNSRAPAENTDEPQPSEVTNEQPALEAPNTPEIIVGAETDATIKTFTVSGKPFSFTPNQIRVKKGDTVKIVFANDGGFHDWVLDEFNARTAQIQSGQTAEVQFVADRTGTFEYYCSVGDHRALGMVGQLIVE